MSVRAYFSVSLLVSLHVLLTVPHSTCRVYSLFIDQCVAVLPTCVARSSPAPRRAAAAAARWPPPQRAKLPCAWRLSAWHSASLRSRGSSSHPRRPRPPVAPSCARTCACFVVSHEMRAKGVKGSSIDAQQAVARARRKDTGQQRMPRDGRWTAPAA